MPSKKIWKAINAPVYWMQLEKGGKWGRKRTYKRHGTYQRAVLKAIKAGFHWTGGITR